MFLMFLTILGLVIGLMGCSESDDSLSKEKDAKE